MGGAHRNYHQMAHTLKDAILRNLAELRQLPVEEMLELRYQKFRAMGPYGTIKAPIPASTHS
jgi:acetyl-CoA carboxylase carboxyl transferase subunit alpha